MIMRLKTSFEKKIEDQKNLNTPHHSHQPVVQHGHAHSPETNANHSHGAEANATTKSHSHKKPSGAHDHKHGDGALDSSASPNLQKEGSGAAAPVAISDGNGCHH